MSMNPIEKLAYRCYKILPLVYDESLSYYEVICKCVEKLNEVINSMDEMVTEFNGWEDQIAEIESSFDTIEATLALHSTQISGLQGDISGLEQTIESLANSITSLTSQISTLGSTVAGHTTQIAGISSDITEIDSQISAIETNVDDLQNDKMNKVNPTGSGAVSINRLASPIGENSIAAGLEAVAQGNNSVSAGQRTQALGNNSCATGYYTQAVGANSHAEGRRSISANVCSHAEGDESAARAAAAHAEGYMTTASGANSHSEGNTTQALGAEQHAAGRYNVPKASGLRVTGNGSVENGQSNAEYLDDYGNLFLGGDIYVGCNADSSGGTKLSKLVYRHVIILRTTGLTGAKGQIVVSFPIYTSSAITPSKQQMKNILHPAAHTPVNGEFSISNEAILGVYYGQASSTPNITVEFIDSSTGKYNRVMFNYTISDSEIEQSYYDPMPTGN